MSFTEIDFHDKGQPQICDLKNNCLKYSKIRKKSTRGFTTPRTALPVASLVARTRPCSECTQCRPRPGPDRGCWARSLDPGFRAELKN